MKTTRWIFSVNTLPGPEEVKLRRKVAELLTSSPGSGGGSDNDVSIAVNAHKYGCTLVTADGGSRRQPGGLLGHAAELHALGIHVVTDSQAVAIVQRHIQRRDHRAPSLPGAVRISKNSSWLTPSRYLRANALI